MQYADYQQPGAQAFYNPNHGGVLAGDVVNDHVVVMVGSLEDVQAKAIEINATLPPPLSFQDLWNEMFAGVGR